jgi:hypothetical protein
MLTNLSFESAIAAPPSSPPKSQGERQVCPHNKQNFELMASLTRDSLRSLGQGAKGVERIGLSCSPIAYHGLTNTFGISRARSLMR